MNLGDSITTDASEAVPQSSHCDSCVRVVYQCVDMHAQCMEYMNVHTLQSEDPMCVHQVLWICWCVWLAFSEFGDLFDWSSIYKKLSYLLTVSLQALFTVTCKYMYMYTVEAPVSTDLYLLSCLLVCFVVSAIYVRRSPTFIKVHLDFFFEISTESTFENRWNFNLVHTKCICMTRIQTSTTCFIPASRNLYNNWWFVRILAEVDDLYNKRW